MGRHVNADAENDEADAEQTTGGDHDGAQHESARHVAQAGHPLQPQAVISADTHVGVELNTRGKGSKDAAASPANPDALIEHGLVGDGHEME
ncbi:MAG: hypothetical protein ABIP33_04390 [Pseudolysinimonas sp.]